MKTVLITALSYLVLAGAALAHEGDTPRSISVAGTVEAKTAPDRIVWSINLTERDPDMSIAKNRSDETVKKVLALRNTPGLKEGDIETGRVSITREYERDARGNRGAFKNFMVRRNITIRQQDLDRFDEFLDALVASSEMEVNFSLESSRIHEVRAETRLKVLKTAKDKAKDMAKVVGAKLGPVLTIREEGQGTGFSFSNNISRQSAPSVDVATDTFIPGAITVRMTVHATFELK